MRVTCKHCGGPHPAFECRKKSTALVSPASINKDGSLRKNARFLVDCCCEVCGKKFEAIPNEVKRGKARTCSKSCAAKLAERPSVAGENNPNWKGGISQNGKTARYKAKYPEKHAAHRLMTAAIRKRELIRGVCEVCGEEKTDGHHDDYSKPLEVRWLCRKHHIDAHHGRFGTQALPVDTNPRQGGSNPAVIDPSGGGLPVFHLPSPKTGAKFDKKTWMRSYMKTYMARYREDVKSGKRTPKKKVKAS